MPPLTEGLEEGRPVLLPISLRYCVKQQKPCWMGSQLGLRVTFIPNMVLYSASHKMMDFDRDAWGYISLSYFKQTNVDKDQVKAAIKAQQDQQIDNALLAEGRFYSDLELTAREIERMVMEASRAEYLATDKLRREVGHKESSTSGAEPSSSGASKYTG